MHVIKDVIEQSTDDFGIFVTRNRPNLAHVLTLLLQEHSLIIYHSIVVPHLALALDMPPPYLHSKRHIIVIIMIIIMGGCGYFWQQ